MATNEPRSKLWLPASLSARGFVLFLIIIASVAIPAIIGHQIQLRQATATADYERDAFLALAVSAYLEHSSEPIASQVPFLEQLYARAKRVRWAGIFSRDGVGVELRQRTAVDTDAVRAQVDLNATEMRSAPLRLAGVTSRRFHLLTFPFPDEGMVLAVVLERERVVARPESATLALLAACGATGLLLAAGWFCLTIQRPIERLGTRLKRVSHGLSVINQESTLPKELATLATTVDGACAELLRSRDEVTLLRDTLDQRVESQTRELRVAHHKAEQNADTDQLTGLANRRALDRELPLIYKRQRAARADLTLVVIDVNNFKMLNDTAGHQAGDELLAFVGELLRGTIRKGVDLAARYGGDEFVLVLPETEASDARTVAQRIVTLFQQRVRTLGSSTVLAGLSAGVVSLRAHGPSSWQELMKQADAAMYWAKRKKIGVALIDEVPATQRKASVASPVNQAR